MNYPGFINGSNTLFATVADAERTVNCACGCGTPIRGKGACVIGHHMRLRPVVRARYRQREGQLLHRLRAERALGRPLPPGAQVHHADGSRSDTAPLVICQDQAYHKLLHTRMRVKAAGGNPNTDRICYTCKAVKPIDAFVKSSRSGWYCKACYNAAKRQRRAAKRESR